MPDDTFYIRLDGLMNALARVVLDSVTDEIDRVEFSVRTELQRGILRPSSFRFASYKNAMPYFFLVSIDPIALASAAQDILDHFKDQAKVPIAIQLEYKRETDGWKQEFVFEYPHEISSRTKESIVRRKSLIGSFFRRLIGE